MTTEQIKRAGIIVKRHVERGEHYIQIVSALRINFPYSAYEDFQNVISKIKK
jgi:hypothetical protein